MFFHTTAHPPVRQTVEQRHLPERTVAVQAMRVEVRDPVQELVLVTRRGERRMTDVRHPAGRYKPPDQILAFLEGL
jgi:hypothetical protein